MQVATYSLSLIAGFVIARLGVEHTSLRLRLGRFRIHHWALATIGLGLLYLWGDAPDYLWGGLTGVALEGLRRKNWGCWE